MSALQRHLSARWIATWLAVFGLVFAPTLSRAMVAVGGASEYAELCSQGAWTSSKQVGANDAALGQLNEDGQLQLHLLTSHCPLCAVASGNLLAPPPAPFALWLGLPQRVVATPLVRARPAEPAACARPQPRAPPLSA